MASLTPTGKRRRAAGFTYVSVIILVALIGLVGAASLKLGSVMRRSAAEKELLNIGAQFSNALDSYAKATPPGQPPYPPSMQELLKDPRFPFTRRHLRKIYVDPLTGTAQWGIVYVGGDKGIVAIHSLSTAGAVKLARFPERFKAFEGKTKVAEWRFTRTEEAGGVPALAPKPGVPGAPGLPAVPGGPGMPGNPVLPPVPAPAPVPAPEPEPEPEPAPAPELEPLPEP